MKPALFDSQAPTDFVGRSVPRKEDERLLTGHGLYVDDVVLPGMVHAVFVRSDYAKATIRSIDTAAARDMPGVVAVFTAADFEGTYGPAFNAQLGEGLPVAAPLATDGIRHVGDPVVLVVADSRVAAVDACELIFVDYDTEKPVADYRTAGETMTEVPFRASCPDLADVIAAAAHVVEVTIEQNRYLCAPMETRGLIASWQPGRGELDIVSSSQGVHEMANFFARFLDIPERNVRVSARDVGGGFGQKMFVSREDCAVVLASRTLGRPVKWIEDRRENLLAAPHSRNEIGDVRVAIGDDGIIQAITVDHRADAGAYPICPAAMDPSLLPGPYKIPRLGFSSVMVQTNTTGRGAYRGPWLFETTAREMALDVTARALGLDPVELRRRNLLSRQDLPFTSPSGHEFSEISPRETLEQALDVLGFEEFRRAQEDARGQGRWLGLGVSVYVEPTAMSTPKLPSEGVTVRLEPSGRVVAFVGTTSHGQSLETTMAQIVADGLGADYDAVTIVQGDTASTPYGPGVGGSRSAVIAGGSAIRASTALRDRVLAIAAHVMEANPADLDLAAGTISVRGTPARTMTIGDVARLVYRDADVLPTGLDTTLEATARFRPDRSPTWSNATHLCVVEVDADTWIPRILRYIVAEDCGRMIHPHVVDGQIAGGVVQGIGGALFENFVYDADGNPLTTSFLDYLVPTAAEVPGIEISHLGSLSTTNPGGFKGLGEGGAIGSHAAVANAVADALAPLGVVVTRTPLGPSEIFSLVQAARQRKDERPHGTDSP